MKQQKDKSPLLALNATKNASDTQTLSYVQLDIEKETSELSPFMDCINDSPEYRKYTKKPSFFKWITFGFMLPFVKNINQSSQKFEIDDMPNPQHKFNIETKLIQMDRYWQHELKNSKPNFSRALIKTFWKEAVQSVALVFVDLTGKLYYSIYMGKIISHISSSKLDISTDGHDIFTSAAILSLLVVVSVFAKGWSYFVVIPNLCKLRLTITALIYKKLHTTSLTSLHEISIGKVLNLVANDINDMQTMLPFFTLLLTPYMIALGTYMMWGYFGASCLVGLLSLILVLYGQILITDLTKKDREENKKTADERVKLTHEVIEGIRLLKMYTWDRLFQNRIAEHRTEEHKSFLRMSNLDALGTNLSISSVFINITIICIVYTFFGGVLTPEKIYATMMILMYLSSSLLASHQGRMALVNCQMITRRVEEILLIDGVVAEDSPDREQLSSTRDEGMPDAVFEDFTGYWSQTAQKPCLSNINLSFKPGFITSIIGKIGAGKSSLLFSFLKEIPITSGTLSYRGRVAYVEQDPIIFSGTIRNNILFGRDYDEALYKQVIKACSLERDLEILSHGDLTHIGERGVNLSGGQKARVSLARAVYSQSDIYLLDDPFSALDSRVARDIFNKTLKGDLLRNKIIILVTHHLHFAKESDHVVLMDEGSVEAQGTFADLEKLNLSLLNVFKIDKVKKKTENVVTKQDSEESEEKTQDESSEKVEEKQAKEEPVEVTFETYKKYFSATNSWIPAIVLLLLFLGSHASMIYYSQFIGVWGDRQHQFFVNNGNTADFNNSYYALVSILLLFMILLIGYLKTAKLFSFVLDADTELHRKMLNALVKAQVLFFDTNPVGRVLNRFSNDIGVLDKANSRLLFDFIDCGLSYLTVLLTICVINPALVIPSVLVLFGLLRIKKFFQKAIILVRTLELVSRSPILSAVPATLQGLIVIRVYNQGGRFIREFMDMLFNNIKSFVLMEQAIRLFGFILETLIQSLTISGVWIFITLVFYFDFESGLLGLCLMYLLKIGDQGSMVIRQSIYVNMNMQSAQRMLEYCEIPSEAPLDIPEKDNQVLRKYEGQWPNRGEISFNNVFMKYRKDLDFALKGLSVHIPGGLKVACIGRTGAGKSSIIQALFRMVEIEKNSQFPDSSIEIDGVDISQIGLHLLRSRLSIIPQTPVIFADTVRKNLDPFDSLSDEELWTVLEEVGLKSYVETLGEQLNTDMTGCATIFSTGQKQLVCLARAIINKSKVIVLDEATANVDVETDSFIQKTIMNKFKDCTVITIAHRLITIADYDRVVVMDAGRVVEYDTPYNLLVKKAGDAKITKSGSVFAEMVTSTGNVMSDKIFTIAKGHYEKLQSRGI